MKPRKSQSERRNQENPKKKKTRKSKKNVVGEHWNHITTLHSENSVTRMGGNQLQPGVEDGGTPIEVVAK